MQPTDSLEMLKRANELRRKYADEVVYYNYPGLLFYLGQCFPWLSTQAQDYFGVTVPYFLFFFREGECSFEHVSYIGPGERIMEQLRKDGSQWVKNHGGKTKEAEKITQEWLSKNRVVRGKTLQEYLKLLEESKNVFLQTHIHFQIAVHIDKHLTGQLSKVFEGSSHNQDEILKLCAPSEISAIVHHDKEVGRFSEWCNTQGIALTLETYGENAKNPEFVKRLRTCYDTGYVLHAGYGGVKLWTLEDEYQYVCKSVLKPKEVKPILSELTPEQKKWVEIARHFIGLRERKKILQARFYFYQAQLLEEIGRIINIPRQELEHLLIEQFTEEFLTSHGIKSVIKEQKEGYLIFWEPQLGFRTWIGDDAVHAFALLESERPKEAAELKGQGACHGKATGTVRIVLNPRLQKTFNEGDILVTGMTSPDFVPLMKKAAAIVTEIGGITCHAAIVAREMGKPCIIGTKIATKVLKDGDLIEVDAEKGIVRKMS